MEYYDFYDMDSEVQNALGYPTRDCGKHFHPEAVSFDTWCDANGKRGKDPEGKQRYSSRIWWKEYENSGAIQVPYMDFWHWQMDNCMCDVSNDTMTTVNVAPSSDFDDIEPWQAEIQDKWHELFKDLAAGDGDWDVDVWISW